MKYLLFSLVCLCIVGCTTEAEPVKRVTTATSQGDGFSDSIIFCNEVTSFTLQKHQYIRFGYGRSQCIVHDPDCSCKDKK